MAKKFIFFFLVSLLSVHVQAMETEQNTSLKAFPATKRFKDIQEAQRKNPDLTMWDPLPLLREWYRHDLAFIKQETSQKNRKNGEWLRDALGTVEKFANARLEQGELTLYDYNFMGFEWATLLGKASHCESLRNFFEYDLGCYEKSIQNKEQDVACLRNLNTGGMTIPHISKTGSVPTSIINDGRGYFIDIKKTQVSFVDFLAVGTDEQQKYDGNIRQSSIENYKHDKQHIVFTRTSSLKAGKDFNMPLAYKAACLRDILKTAQLERRKKVGMELAFFEIFHESVNPTNPLEALFTTYYDKDENIRAIAYDNHADINFYKLRISQAESLLKQKLAGPEMPEKYCEYLKLLNEGYKIINLYTDVYHKADYTLLLVTQ